MYVPRRSQLLQLLQSCAFRAGKTVRMQATSGMKRFFISFYLVSQESPNLPLSKPDSTVLGTVSARQCMRRETAPRGECSVRTITLYADVLCRTTERNTRVLNSDINNQDRSFSYSVFRERPQEWLTGSGLLS
ncbi:hypothetical protein SBA6_1090006 [Candidatus Sulfopaludibacter sp. SbA6]|nr:hypothetical protein SBA6_1090006 [Candidatus Sulfopaludibacter sp. SbA6]